ncbi:MAG: hypothetical protein DVB28_000409 [Verrucomicrobia bacterium]|nr:MAG: hypothetical protein DVB28_000409 [Verrucomicrobiota bacterium]
MNRFISKFGAAYWLVLVFLAGGRCRLVAAPARLEPEMSWLENDRVIVGIDLKMGGSITSVRGKPDGRELVNNYDHGRQVQMSFYSGPVPFVPNGLQPHPAWRALGWNPVQSGDWAGNASKVLEHRNTGSEMYTKAVPLQWPLEGVESECEMESWIRLEAQSIQVRCRVTNRRADRIFYPAKHQEIPAVYTNGEFRRVVTYSGDRPFTGGALNEWLDPGPPWKTFSATERWAALVDSKNWGLGVWQPATTYWKQGEVPGEVGKQGQRDNATGYLAPVALEHLDYNITYEYEFRLVPGSVEEIRALVREWERGRELPQYRFEKGRVGWTLRGGIDGGVPLPGMWRVQAQTGTVFLEGPASFWRADAAGTLKISALLKAQSGRLRVAWKGIRPEEPEGSAVFEVPVGGVRKEHSFVLKGQPGYKGGLQRLMLRFEALKPGEILEVESIRLEP